MHTFGMDWDTVIRLPSWKFDLLVNYAQKLQARSKLSAYQTTSVAAWGDSEARKSFIEDMLVEAGYKSREPVKTIELPTEAELIEKLGNKLGSMRGFSLIRKAEEVA